MKFVAATVYQAQYGRIFIVGVVGEWIAALAWASSRTHY